MRLPEDTAKERFGSAPVARLATVDEIGRPHIVVTTFAVAGDHIYLAVDEKPKTTRRLKRLRNIAANPAVALLADRYDDDWDMLWWVRADGRAEVIDDPAGAAQPIRLLVERYPQYQQTPPLGPVIVVTVDRWTSWAAAPSS